MNTNKKGETMELKYFNIYDMSKLTEALLKKLWRRVVLDVHPDKGGNHEKYLEAQAEYDYLLKHIGQPFYAREDSPEAYDNFDMFMASINPMVREAYLATINIVPTNRVEICSMWLWVTLEKSEVERRKSLKELEINGKKYRFNGKKNKWSWAGCPKLTHRNHTMREIREYFGSKTYKGKAEEEKEEREYEKIGN
jgi:hypothetical protein